MTRHWRSLEGSGFEPNAGPRASGLLQEMNWGATRRFSDQQISAMRSSLADALRFHTGGNQSASVNTPSVHRQFLINLSHSGLFAGEHIYDIHTQALKHRLLHSSPATLVSERYNALFDRLQFQSDGSGNLCAPPRLCLGPGWWEPIGDWVAVPGQHTGGDGNTKTTLPVAKQPLPGDNTGGSSNPPGGDPNAPVDPITQLAEALTSGLPSGSPTLPQDVPYAQNVTQGPNIMLPLVIMAIGGFGIYYWYKHRHQSEAK